MKSFRAVAVATSCILAACGCVRSPPARAAEPIVGLPCDGCENVFVGMPAKLASSARIAPLEEPGEPMRIEGTVLDRDARPAAGVIVYAYHTDSGGIYPRDSTRHGRLRGWAQSDERGRYRFDTIRPAGYPNTQIPAHVHMHVIEPGRCTSYLDSIHFEDDPRLTPGERARQDGRGGSGIVLPRKDAGVWVVVRDIRLGEQVPGYLECLGAEPRQ